MRETRNYIARRLIKSDNFGGNRKKKTEFRGGEFIATRRGSGNSFTLAACSFQKQKRIIPPLHPLAHVYLHTRRIGEKLFRRSPASRTPGGGSARV